MEGEKHRDHHLEQGIYPETTVTELQMCKTGDAEKKDLKLRTSTPLSFDMVATKSDDIR